MGNMNRENGPGKLSINMFSVWGTFWVGGLGGENEAKKIAYPPQNLYPFIKTAQTCTCRERVHQISACAQKFLSRWLSISISMRETTTKNRARQSLCTEYRALINRTL